MKRFVTRLAAALAVAAALAALITQARARLGRLPPPLAMTVERAPFTETVRARGHVEAARFADIRAPTSPSDRQLIWVAAEGSIVRQGETVAEFDSEPLLQRIEDLKNDLRALEMSREDIETLMKSRIFEERTNVLTLEQNRILTEIREQALTYESGLRRTTGQVQSNIAAQRIESGKSRLKAFGRMKKTREAVKTEQAVNMLGRIAQVEAELDQFTIAASADSIVLLPPVPVAGELRKVVAGDFLGRGQAFLRLPDLSSLVVRVLIGEADLDRVRPGLVARVTPVFDRALTFGGEVGVVSRNAASAGEASGRQLFEATVLPGGDAPLGQLKVGMVVDVGIILREHGDVFAIPIDLTRRDGPAWSVRRVVAPDLPPEPLPLPGAEPCGDFLIAPDIPGAGDAVSIVFEPGKP